MTTHVNTSPLQWIRSGTLLAALIFATFVNAADLSNATISGKWTFTHMLLDGETEMAVNRAVEFTQNGEATWYDAAGNKNSMGSFSINDGNIDYQDDNGLQKWKVMEFSGEGLQVDHKGAVMFFKRQ